MVGQEEIYDLLKEKDYLDNEDIRKEFGKVGKPISESNLSTKLRKLVQWGFITREQELVKTTTGMRQRFKYTVKKPDEVAL